MDIILEVGTEDNTNNQDVAELSEELEGIHLDNIPEAPVPQYGFKLICLLAL